MIKINRVVSSAGIWTRDLSSRVSSNDHSSRDYVLLLWQGVLMLIYICSIDWRNFRYRTKSYLRQNHSEILAENID